MGRRKRLKKGRAHFGGEGREKHFRRLKKLGLRASSLELWGGETAKFGGVHSERCWGSLVGGRGGTGRCTERRRGCTGIGALDS